MKDFVFAASIGLYLALIFTFLLMRAVQLILVLIDEAKP